MIRIKRLSERARIPTYATDGAACFDVCSADHPTTIRPGEVKKIGTGWAVQVPYGHAMFLFSRSGMALGGVSLANGVGVIDSDYRGEVCVLLANRSDRPCAVNTGDRIAQGMVMRFERVAFDVAENLSETARGEGGFGSTGR